MSWSIGPVPLEADAIIETAITEHETATSALDAAGDDRDAIEAQIKAAAVAAVDILTELEDEYGTVEVSANGHVGDDWTVTVTVTGRSG